jgi:hypothetical protein
LIYSKREIRKAEVKENMMSGFSTSSRKSEARELCGTYSSVSVCPYSTEQTENCTSKTEAWDWGCSFEVELPCMCETRDLIPSTVKQREMKLLLESDLVVPEILSH